MPSYIYMEKKLKTMKIYNHKVDIYKSNIKNKKYKAIVDDEKTMHFGDNRYE